MKTVWVLKKETVCCGITDVVFVGVFSTEEKLREYVSKQIDKYNYEWTDVEIDELLEQN